MASRKLNFDEETKQFIALCTNIKVAVRQLAGANASRTKIQLWVAQSFLFDMSMYLSSGDGRFLPSLPQTASKSMMVPLRCAVSCITGADASMHFMECAYIAPQMSENSLPCGRHICSATLRPSRVCAVDLFGLIFEGICVCLGELLLDL